jgi:putative hemolysin
MQRFVITMVLAAVLIVLLIQPGAAMKDPSAVYCQAMGYSYEIVQSPDGPAGACRMPDGTMADSWKFLQGKEGRQFSWCTQQGYGQQVARSYRTCSQFGLDECLVCVLPDGTTREVTQLMNLSFAETTCGDGSCGAPENVITCPADCKPGGWDNLCDGKRDGLCDPDCPDGTGDPDCVAAPDYRVIAGILAIVIAGIAIILFLRKKKGTG